MRAPLLLLAAAPALLASCDLLTFRSPEVPGAPAGVILGTVTYAGALPCTREGRVVGAALLTVFDVRALPPPDGLGSSAASLQVVAGDELFAGVSSSLTFREDGSLWCPEPGEPTVTVSAPFVVSPLAAGAYQVRGFYDRDGDFDPLFSISNQPTQGDVAGGAITNAAAVAAGARPEFRVLELGEAGATGVYAFPDGDGDGIAEDGAVVSGVAVTLGLPLPLERPVFHVSELLDSTPGDWDTGSAEAPAMPSDFQLDTFSLMDPAGTEASFVRLRLGAGVASYDAGAAKEPPFSLPTQPLLFVSRQDANRDGVIDAEDHLPESASLKALWPSVVASKLDPDAPEGVIRSQKAPAVILQAVTLLESLLGTAAAPDDLALPASSVVIALRPSAICLPADPAEPATLVLSHPTDAAGVPLVSDPVAVAGALSAQLGRDVVVEVGCLPQGEYALNVIYPTGQTWRLPNEAGVCAPTETISEEGGTCGTRPRLRSQATTLRIGPPADPAYCVEHPTPAACLPP